MTREEHLALDRAVALEVFGQEWEEDLILDDTGGGWRCLGHLGKQRNERKVNMVLPSYSRSIAAAFEILHLHSARGHTLSLEYDQDYGIHHRQGWSLAINGIHYSEFAETPCLAICRAALKRKRISEDEEEAP